MMKTGSKPIVLKVGNVQVKVYRSQRRKNGSTYDQFDVADYSTGKRRFVSFANEGDAREKATEIATRLANREAEVLTLSTGDRAAYLRAREFLQPTGVAIELAAAQFADAHKKLAGRSLAEAVSYFTRRIPTSLPRRTVTEVLKELLAAKTTDGASPAYLKDLEFRLGKLADAFQCKIGSVTAVELNAFLRTLECSGRSRNNFRRAIGTLFNFAEVSGFLPKLGL